MAKEDQTKHAPSPDTAFQPGGVKARDAARRDVAKEMDSIRRMKKLDSQINRAIRRGNAKKAQQFSDLKKAMGGNPFDTAGGNIANVADTRSQARVNYNEKAEKRFKMGQEEAADAVEPAPVPENLNKGVDGKPVPETQQPYTVGQAKPSEQSPILPNPADELEESVFEKDAREAQERSTESGAFGDQKKQEALGEKFGPGARDTKQKFLDDLENSSVINTVNPALFSEEQVAKGKAAREKAYQRADELDVSREELQKKMEWDTDSEVAEKADKKSKEASESVRGEVGESEEGAYEKGVKAYEDMGLTRADYDRVRKEKFDDNSEKFGELDLETNSLMGEAKEARKWSRGVEEMQTRHKEGEAKLEIDNQERESKLSIEKEARSEEFKASKSERQSEEKARIKKASHVDDEYQRVIRSAGSSLPIVDNKSLIKSLKSAPGPFSATILANNAVRDARAFNKALGGSDGEFGKKDHNAFPALKKKAMENNSIQGNFFNPHNTSPEANKAKDKLIKASLDSGRSLEDDKELMGDADFVKRLQRAKTARKIKSAQDIGREYDEESKLTSLN